MKRIRSYCEEDPGARPSSSASSSSNNLSLLYKAAELDSELAASSECSDFDCLSGSGSGSTNSGSTNSGSTNSGSTSSSNNDKMGQDDLIKEEEQYKHEEKDDKDQDGSCNKENVMPTPQRRNPPSNTLKRHASNQISTTSLKNASPFSIATKEQSDDGKIVKAAKKTIASNASNASQRFSNVTSASASVLYCKARGMPLDHFGSGAILQFDEGYERVHGAELKCSHLTCQKDGIKFRWCGHCCKSVAKRNFRKRHAHPELDDLNDQPLLQLQPRLQPQLKPHLQLQPHITHQHQCQQLQEQEWNHPAATLTTTNDVTMTYPCPPLPPPTISSSDSASITNQQKDRQDHIDIDHADANEDDEEDESGGVNCNNPSLVPTAWNDLFHIIPHLISDEDKKGWLEQVARFANISPSLFLYDTGGTVSPTDLDLGIGGSGSLSSSINASDTSNLSYRHLRDGFRTGLTVDTSSLGSYANFNSAGTLSTFSFSPTPKREE